MGVGVNAKLFCGEAANSLTYFARERNSHLPHFLPFLNAAHFFIAFDDEIKLANHRKGDVHVIRTKRLLLVGPLWIFSILVDVYNI